MESLHCCHATMQRFLRGTVVDALTPSQCQLIFVRDWHGGLQCDGSAD